MTPERLTAIRAFAYRDENLPALALLEYIDEFERKLWEERERCVSAVESQRGKVSVRDLSKEAMLGVFDWLVVAIREGPK